MSYDAVAGLAMAISVSSLSDRDTSTSTGDEKHGSGVLVKAAELSDAESGISMGSITVGALGLRPRRLGVA